MRPTPFFATLCAAAALFFASPAFAQSQAAGASIGYVDLQTALNTVEEGVSARSELEADFARRQTELREAETELEEWVAQQEAGASAMTPEAMAEAQREYEQRLMDLQRRLEANRQELVTAEAAATEQIFERMVEIVAEVADERGYTVVLEKSTILYAPTEMEFTEELVRRYNERY